MAPPPEAPTSKDQIPLGPPLRKLPLGIQDFPRLRNGGNLYVDKTALVYKMVTEGSVYFLSRPRRFGKSLLVSTLGAYWEGRRELFAGLAIEELEQEWTAYPVLRLDLNAENFTSLDALRTILNRHLESWELRFPPGKADRTPAERFLGVIERAYAQTGQRVVVLVDEYDSPLLSVLDRPELLAEYKAELKGFYGVLKSADAWLKFALLTGVSKFGQVSVFSGFNQPTDLSLHPDYATLCGITQSELEGDFAPELAAMAAKRGLSLEECLEQMRRTYNGYKFHPEGESVYNPFSTLSALSTKEIRDYWFQTGTPSFLVDLLKRTNTDLRDLDGVELLAQEFANYQADPDRPLPVIYQSGYLTIQSYDPSCQLYTLGYPNEEVRRGFLYFLLPYFTGAKPGNGGMHIGKFLRELSAGDVEGFLTRLRAFFEALPYDLNDQSERHYQVIFYLVFTLLGQIIQAEVKTAKGRADAVVWTANKIFVFEFKLHGTAEQALAQIDEKGYAVPYSAEGRTVVKVGVEFDKATRNLGRWLVVDGSE